MILLCTVGVALSYDEPWQLVRESNSSLGIAPQLRQHSVVWDGSRVLVFGGLRPKFGLQDSTWVFEPAFQVWALLTVQNAPLARSAHSSLWTGSQMLVFGGMCGAYCFLDDMWTLDPGGKPRQDT